MIQDHDDAGEFEDQTPENSLPEQSDDLPDQNKSTDLVENSDSIEDSGQLRKMNSSESIGEAPFPEVGIRAFKKSPMST